MSRKHNSIYSITFAVFLAFCVSQCSSANEKTNTESAKVTSIKKREARVVDGTSSYDSLNKKSIVKRSDRDELFQDDYGPSNENSEIVAEKRQYDSFVLEQDPEKRARNKHMRFFGVLGKRDDPEEGSDDSFEKRRRYNSKFIGSLGKRRFNSKAFIGSLGKRRFNSKAFIGSLGKRRFRNSKSFVGVLGKRSDVDEDLLNDFEKRRMINRFKMGFLGKRNEEELEPENESDVDKRRMNGRVFGVLGKRFDDADEFARDQRARQNRFRFMGSLGKRFGTSYDDNDDVENLEDENNVDKRRFKTKGFYGVLGKRDGGDEESGLEKRRRMNKFAFGSLGKRSLEDLDDESELDSPFRQHTYLVQLGKRSVDNESPSSRNEVEHLRKRRSVHFGEMLSSGLRDYARPRRFNRYRYGRRRLGRRAPDFRFLPSLGKRTFGSYGSDFTNDF